MSDPANAARFDRGLERSAANDVPLSPVAFLQRMETLPVALDFIGIQVHEEAEGGERGLIAASGVNPFTSSNSSVETPVLRVTRGLLIDMTLDTIIYVKQ